MCPIEKAGPASELAVHQQQIDPFLRKKINEGNIWKVLTELPGEYTEQDIFDFIKAQHSKFADIEQNYLTMSLEADIIGPKFATTAKMLPESMCSDQDKKGLAELFLLVAKKKAELETKKAELQSKSKSAEVQKEDETFETKGKGKFAVAAKSSAAKATDASQEEDFSADGILGGAQNYLDNMDDWTMNNYDAAIFDLQLKGQLEAKNSELQAEMNNIIARVRSGDLDAIWILVALAKVNCSRNGLLFSQFGKKMWRLNDTANKAMEELIPKSYQDPAQLQVLQQKQKEIGFQQQFLIQDMQKLASNIEQTFGFVTKTIDEIIKTRMHITNAPFKSL